MVKFCMNVFQLFNQLPVPKVLHIPVELQEVKRNRKCKQRKIYQRWTKDKDFLRVTQSIQTCYLLTASLCNPELVLSIEEVVAVAYEQNFYVGIVEEMGHQQPSISFLKRMLGNKYQIPKTLTKESVDPLFIFFKPMLAREGNVITLTNFEEVKTNYQT